MTDQEFRVESESFVRVRPPAGTRRIRVLPERPGEEHKHAFVPIEDECPLWATTMASSAAVSASVEAMPALNKSGDDPTKGYLSRRRTTVREVLAWFAGFDGFSWQERWESSGIEDDELWLSTINDARNAVNGTLRKQGDISVGVAWLIAADAFRPSYEWLHRQHEMLRSLPMVVLGVRDPAGAKKIDDAIEDLAPTELIRARYRTSARFQLARILGHTGKQRIDEISPDDLSIARESARGQRKKIPSGATYNAMSRAGMLPADAPVTFVNTRRTGRLTVEQLVDRTGIQSPKMRDLFVDYFRVRSTGLDYNSLGDVIRKVVLHFWVELEGLQPGIETLNLPPDLVDEWKEHVRIIRHGNSAGKPRKDHGSVMLAVRAFYFDINDWAQSDPERYAKFGARNPIGPGDTVAFAKEKRRQRASSHQRTRQRLPHLPALMTAIWEQLRWHREVLDEARGREPGERFEVKGIVCEVAVSNPEPFGRVHRGHKKSGGLTVHRLDTDRYFDAVQQETIYFWRWAAFTVLKETGIRIEEMEELTHTSIAQFRMPSTGELLPLLQIAPSKTDKERVILVSPELADVLASMIARVRDSAESGRIPLIRRWDYQEKQLSDPMPFLFQRRIDGEDRPVNRAWVLRNLRSTVDDLGLVDEAGEPIYFQNHDMRRIFATEAVMAGLPIHILANVLGHDSLDTTQQYAAIYDEEVYRRHRAFIERRRAIRPSVEYRQPTPEEFQEFLGHFERRQLELGVCGRAYGTPCIHEHACIRCSMLQPDPTQVARYREIIQSLEARIGEARTHGWFGEIEGLEVSLAGARQKLGSIEKTPDGPVLLGLPTIRVGAD